MAARVARWFGSSLPLGPVVSAVTAPAGLQRNVSAHDRIALGRAETQLETLAASGRRLVPTDARVVCGQAADDIAALVVAERISLVTTALRDRRSWFGTRRGSVSYHVLSHAVAPVLHIRRRGGHAETTLFAAERAGRAISRGSHRRYLHSTRKPHPRGDHDERDREYTAQHQV